MRRRMRARSMRSLACSCGSACARGAGARRERQQAGPAAERCFCGSTWSDAPRPYQHEQSRAAADACRPPGHCVGASAARPAAAAQQEAAAGGSDRKCPARLQRLLLGAALGVDGEVHVAQRALDHGERVRALRVRVDALVRQHAGHVLEERRKLQLALLVRDLAARRGVG